MSNTGKLMLMMEMLKVMLIIVFSNMVAEMRVAVKAEPVGRFCSLNLTRRSVAALAIATGNERDANPAPL